MDSLVDKYTQQELEQIVQLSTSYKDLAQKLGYTAFSSDLKYFLENKFSDFDTSHFKIRTQEKERVVRTEANVFVEDSTATQKTLRTWYRKGNYTPYQCSICHLEPIWQGKPLTLILDHINGINNDDRLENLRWVCPNCNQQLETTNGKNRKSYSKKYYCIDCGKELSGNYQRCKSCAGKVKIVPIKEIDISREELKFLIRNKTFAEIGRNFNVSDNAVRKWCDKLNLPRTKSLIRTYSDEEWDKL